MPDIVSYKSIVRVDYPIAYGILDRLGRFCAATNEATSGLGFVEVDLKANPTAHAIAGRMKTATDDGLIFNLQLSSIDCLVEHKQGYKLGSFHKHEGVQLLDAMMTHLQNDPQPGLKTLNRIGLRFWIVIQEGQLTFDKLRSHFASSVAAIEKPISKHFPSTEDVGIVLEARNEDENIDVRAQLGPYQPSEQSKYFSIDQEIGEGLILDLDVYQRSIEIPGFRLSQVVRRWERIAREVASGIGEDLIKRAQ